MIPSLLRSPLHAGHWTETCTDPVVNLCTCVFLTSAPLLEGAQICPFPLKSSNSPKFLFKLKWVFPTFPGSWLDLIVQVSSEADKPCNDSRHLHTAEGHTRLQNLASPQPGGSQDPKAEDPWSPSCPTHARAELLQNWEKWVYQLCRSPAGWL